jgi:hypothetical protein
MRLQFRQGSKQIQAHAVDFRPQLFDQVRDAGELALIDRFEAVEVVLLQQAGDLNLLGEKRSGRRPDRAGVPSLWRP